MANEEQLKILRQGVAVWNEWRAKNPGLRPDLTKADLRGANLWRVNLDQANLSGAILRAVDFSGAILSEADLGKASLISADLRGANLHRANLWGADLKEANLSAAYLGGAQLIGTDFCDAMLTGSTVYGVSVWDIKVNDRTEQQNLIITAPDEPVITVDNLKVAQFIYLLLNHREIREVIDTVGRKLVLILGRFTPGRKRVLDALRDELRRRDFLPVVFDFEKPTGRDLTETISPWRTWPASLSRT